MTFAITTLFTFLVAPPNPVTDDENDESNEIDTMYKYPDFSHTDSPYWKAWDLRSQKRLNEHDSMEALLRKLRPLDFKLREAWTKTDKPFMASH